MTSARDLAGRSAVVTGGARGLGHAIARRLGEAGARVTVVDHPSALDGADCPGNPAPIDLAAEDAQARLVDLAETLGTTDIVVANAGLVPPWRPIDGLDRDEWHRVMTVNVWAVAATIGAFADALGRSSHGSVIVMASINAYRAHPAQVLYTASKHAVLGVMRSAARSLGPQGTRVNALAPGPVATDALLQRIDARHAAGGPARDDALAALAAETSLGRMATADEIARAAHFLACDTSSGITGAVLPVEAGLS